MIREDEVEWRKRFTEKWQQMQTLAAVRWLGMPEGTTPEEFIAEVKRRGLLSEPEEDING